MYEALREMVVASPAGGHVTLQAGDEVPGFHAWPLVNQRAAIRGSMVRERPPGAAPAAPGHWPSQVERREALLHLHQKQPCAADNAPSAVAGGQEDVSSEGPAWAPLQGIDPANDDRPPILAAEPVVAGVTMLREEVVEPDPADAPVHMCGDCSFEAATAQGLRLHMTRKHPK